MQKKQKKRMTMHCPVLEYVENTNNLFLLCLQACAGGCPPQDVSRGYSRLNMNSGRFVCLPLQAECVRMCKALCVQITWQGDAQLFDVNRLVTRTILCNMLMCSQELRMTASSSCCRVVCADLCYFIHYVCANVPNWTKTECLKFVRCDAELCNKMPEC